MSKAPPIPPEQRSFKGDAAARLDSARPDRRDLDDDVLSLTEDRQAADLDHQGQSGNLRQNRTPQRSVQDR